MNPYRTHEVLNQTDLINALAIIDNDFDPSDTRFSYICTLNAAGFSDICINKAMSYFWPKDSSE